MSIGVAAVDANLLVPIVACDFLLTAFEHRIFELIVSTTALDEVERTLIETFRKVDPAGLQRRVEHMRAALADQTVDATSPLSTTVINTKDCHIVAAAVAAEAACLVTNDSALRSEIAASGLGIEPLDGNSFVARMWEASPTDVNRVVRVLIDKRRRRPVSPREMAAQLGVHFPAMASAWLAQLDDIPNIAPDQ